jgi:hypothetical protein
MNATANLLLLACGAALLSALTAIGAWGLWNFDHDLVVWIMLLEAGVYAAVAWHAWRSEGALGRTGRRALVLIIVTAVLGRLLLLMPPPLSTDIYRYVWDGRVQAAGINPYRYRPADPEVAFLRDPTIFPKINRAASAVTIYPPMAQAIFLGVTRLSERVTAMKAAMAAFDLVSIGALLALLRRHGLPQTRVLFYAWHPLPLFEFAGSGHIDAAAIALMLLACLCAERRWSLAAGALLAAATLVKFFPAVIAPALYRRWDWRFPAAMLGAVVALYLPYLGMGREALGFLPAYFHEEGLTAGDGFFALHAIGAWVSLPAWASSAYVLVALALLAAAASAVLLRRNAASVPLGSALLLLALFTVALSPHLDWYFAWVIPFLCFSPSWAWIYLSGAAPLLYAKIWTPGPLALNAALYLPFLALLAVELFVRLRMPRLESSIDRIDRNLGSRHAG